MVAVDAVGYEGQPFSFPIELGKIREMARALGSTQADYLTDEHAVVPPTFLKLAQFYWEPPASSVIERIAFDPSNPPLHAEQEFEYLGPPPRAGDRLEVRSRVESIEAKPSRRFGELTYVRVLTEYRNADGEVVATARTTSVVTPKAGTEVAS